MNNRSIALFFFLIFILPFMHSRAAEEARWSNCDFQKDLRQNIERWLNRSLKEAKKAIEDGTEYDGKVHKLEQCKIDEIKNIYNKIKVEYDCSCGECGRGGPSHEIAPHYAVIRICDPIASWLDYIDNDLTQPQKTMCGCPHGLIVHELVHAAGDPTEAGAVDCARILYPCANDATGEATPDHTNCKCCKKKG